MQSIELKGSKYVVIPEHEYEKLRDLADDRIDLAKIQEQINEESFPSELVNKIILDGINPITVFREYRKLTKTKLAELVGVSQSYISNIENNKKDGSINVIKRIANVLEVDIDMIV